MPMYDFGTAMKKLKFLVSLTTNDNDYQIEQAADAEAAAKRLGIEIRSFTPTMIPSPRASKS